MAYAIIPSSARGGSVCRRQIYLWYDLWHDKRGVIGGGSLKWVSQSSHFGGILGTESAKMKAEQKVLAGTDFVSIKASRLSGTPCVPNSIWDAGGIFFSRIFKIISSLGWEIAAKILN